MAHIRFHHQGREIVFTKASKWILTDIIHYLEYTRLTFPVNMKYSGAKGALTKPTGICQVVIGFYVDCRFIGMPGTPVWLVDGVFYSTLLPRSWPSYTYESQRKSGVKLFRCTELNPLNDEPLKSKVLAAMKGKKFNPSPVYKSIREALDGEK